MTLSDLEFILIGYYYGYPKCCILNFLDRFHDKAKITDVQTVVAQHNGFVPCPDCAEKLLEKRITMEELLKNRVCKVPYPDNGFNEDMKKYVTKKALKIIDRYKVETNEQGG